MGFHHLGPSCPAWLIAKGLYKVILINIFIKLNMFCGGRTESTITQQMQNKRSVTVKKDKYRKIVED